MTITRCLILLLLLVPSSAVALSSIETTATITAVTLYQDRALTVRTATARLKPGSNLIIITGLPVLMQDDSLRVEGTGTAGTTINSIEVRRRFLEQSAEKRVKEIEGEITALELTLNRLDSKRPEYWPKRTSLTRSALPGATGYPGNWLCASLPWLNLKKSWGLLVMVSQKPMNRAGRLKRRKNC